MEEAGSGESDSPMESERSEDRAQRNRGQPGSREDSSRAGAELTEAEQAMQVSSELPRDVTARAPSASINPTTVTSPTESSSGRNPLIQPAEQDQSNREPESPSSDSGDSETRRDPRYTGAIPYVGDGTASIERRKGGNDAGPTRRDSLSSTEGPEAPFDLTREEGLERLWKAEGQITKKIESERKERSERTSEEAPGIRGEGQYGQPGNGSDEAQSPPKSPTAEEEIKEKKLSGLADGLATEFRREQEKYHGDDSAEQGKTQAEKPGGRAKDMAARRKDLKQRKSGDRKTGSEPDVKSAPLRQPPDALRQPPDALRQPPDALRQPPSAPPSILSFLPSGTDSEQGSRDSGESYVPTPQESGSTPVSSVDPDTPAYREFREESLIGRRVDRRLADAKEQEEWAPGPDRPEPAKIQRAYLPAPKRNDLKKKLEATEALLKDEEETSADLRVELERAKAYLQSNLDSKQELKHNLQIENDALRKKISEGRPDPTGVQEELEEHVERCQKMKAKITEMQGEITGHQAAAMMVEEDQALVTAKHERLKINEKI